MNYEDWNRLLGQHFFAEKRCGHRVYLNLTQELLVNLSDSTNASQDFVHAMKAGYSGNRKGLICDAAASLAETAVEGEFPPFLGYLCLFTLAAAFEGDFPPHAYYPRLRALLDEPADTGTYPHFEKVTPLWSELEHWSCVTMRGALGLFIPRWYVKWKHVGPPMGQSLLADEEIRLLPAVFAAAGLDCSSVPSQTELQGILRTYGARFRARTQRLLENTSDEEEIARDALLETVQMELSEWDGIGSPDDAIRSLNAQRQAGRVTSPRAPRHALSPQAGCESQEQSKNGTLRLCCTLDLSASTVLVSVRCKSPDQVSEEGLELVDRDEPSSQYWCDEESVGNGWSTEIKAAEDQVVNASTWNWLEEKCLVDSRLGYSFRFRPKPVRIFASGLSFGLPGYVEVHALSRGVPFRLFVSNDIAPVVDRWGSAECRGWRTLSPHGLQAGWRMFLAEEAISDEGIRRQLPLLSFPANTRIHLVGGIKVDRTDSFFDFAPPRLMVDSPQTYILRCNGTQLTADGDGLYDLPTADFRDRFTVEVFHGEEVASRRSLFLTDSAAQWNDAEALAWEDSHGLDCNQTDSPSACGAIVRNLNPEPFPYVGAVPVLSWASAKFIGRQPGQVVHWPEEALSDEWDPVWLIMAKRKGQVMFCGDCQGDLKPSAVPTGDIRRIREWKQYVWHERKHIAPPSNQKLRALWQEYQKLASRL